MSEPCPECDEPRPHLHGEFTLRNGSISPIYYLPREATDEAVVAIGDRWIDWMGQPPRPITNHLGAAMEAVDALKAQPALLRRLMAEAEAAQSDDTK